MVNKPMAKTEESSPNPKTSEVMPRKPRTFPIEIFLSSGIQL